MMGIQFNEKGYVTAAGNVRVYYYDAKSKEYRGWSDEYIHVGVSLPGNSTMIAPGEPVAGQAWIFDDGQWQASEDHRGETVYSIADRSAVRVNYLGGLKEGFVSASPATDFDIWNGSEWVTDTVARHAAAVEDAERYRTELINAALASIAVIQLKLQAGRTLTDDEQSQLNRTLDYIDAVNATKTDILPVDWPTLD
ncbi:tail fiber assembly protein [Kluyvera chengduensis]|uniref:tail fiber assembly protein n=1 Tax=Kluyvera sp. 142359 TaxID=3375726 RepID=UPI0037737CE6